MITSKLSNIDNNILSKIANLAIQHNAIDLATSFSDFSCCDDLENLIKANVTQANHQYGSYDGIIDLRKKISALVEHMYQAKYDPDTEITITNGANSAISTVVTTFVREEEEVIVFEPAYHLYTPLLRINGAMPVYVKLKQPDYSIDWDELNRAITARTRLIILNSPHNPTGRVFSKEDMEKLSRIVAGSKIVILSDEVYGLLSYSDFQSVSRFPELTKRSIVVGSFSKIFQLNGWNAAYVLAPTGLTKEFRKIYQYLGNPCNNVIQHALAQYLTPDFDFATLRQVVIDSYKQFSTLIETTKFKPLPIQGGYFQLLDYSAISDEKDTVFAQRLLTDYAIATVPFSSFYHDKTDLKLIRVCFAKSVEVLKRAVGILSGVTPPIDEGK